MQTVIVIFIVFLAALYLIRTIKNGKHDSTHCGCGCASCPSSSACSDMEENKKP